ncbi:MAG: hypothetical protein KDD00_17440 [Ignavibacteriae bacterium]|nr:hypothetical protein [Ignavibacteriota bacterium]
MKNLTKIQKVTLLFIILYVVWEIAVQIWARSLPSGDPVIRADLIFIYPVLLIMIIISIVQLIISGKKKNV